MSPWNDTQGWMIAAVSLLLLLIIKARKKHNWGFTLVRLVLAATIAGYALVSHLASQAREGAIELAIAAAGLVLAVTSLLALIFRALPRRWMVQALLNLLVACIAGMGSIVAVLNFIDRPAALGNLKDLVSWMAVPELAVFLGYMASITLWVTVVMLVLIPPALLVRRGWRKVVRSIRAARARRAALTP